ncbi:hypothetical protein KI387_006069, partial [Taxus chinensis]
YVTREFRPKMGQRALFNFGTFGTKSSEGRGSGESAENGTEGPFGLGTFETKSSGIRDSAGS